MCHHLSIWFPKRVVWWIVVQDHQRIDEICRMINRSGPLIWVLLQASFWLFIFAFVLDYFFAGDNLEEAVIYTLLECGIYIFIFYVNLIVLIPVLFDQRKTWVFYPLGIITLLVLMLLGYHYSGLADILAEESLWRANISFSLNFMLFIMISFLYWYFEQYQVQQKRTLMLANEKLKTEVDLLKSQVSPHFLFNSLNNIYSLALTKDDNAPRLIQLLSEILRYLIYDGTANRVKLSTEVEMIGKYLEIQKLKKVKGERNIRFSTSGIGDSDEISPLMLITFVENAVKHGDIAYNADAYIHIDINAKEDGRMIFKVSNSKQSSQQPGGVGLNNVRKQLELNYPKTHLLDISETETDHTVYLTLND